MTNQRCKCGKVTHRNKGTAYATLKRLKNAAMDVYRCENGNWHCGRTRDPYRCAWRIDQILERHKRELEKRLRTTANCSVVPTP